MELLGMGLPAGLLAQTTEVSETIWLNAPEPWLIALIVSALVGFSVMMYWLEGRGRPLGPMGVILMIARALVLLVVLGVLFTPVQSLVVSEPKESYVAVLIDRSLSMTFKDRYGDSSLTADLAEVADLDPARIEDTKRIDLVRRALTKEDGAWFDALRRKNRVRLYAFDADRRPLHELAKVTDRGFAKPTGGAGGAPGAAGGGDGGDGGDGTAGEGEAPIIEDPVESLARAVKATEELEADGRETAIGEAITSVLSDLRSERLAAIVLITDGQNNVRSITPEKAARRCKRRAPEPVPVHTVLVGNPAEPKDVALDQLQAPDVAIAGDILNFDFVVSQKGYDGRDAQVVLKFNDVEVRTEMVHFREPEGTDAKKLDLKREYATRLQFKPDRPGDYSIEIRVPTLPDELTGENNVLRHRLRVIDQKIKVLYVEGYPRWEYRYFKNVLVRERSMEAQCLLLSADPGFVQESSAGTPPLFRFPQSREDLFQYHVIIFGDVDPSATDAAGQPVFPDDAFKWIKEFVEDFGGGFLMIAGESDAPKRYADTPIADILPILIDSNPKPPPGGVWGEPFRPRLTRDGRTHPVMRLEQDEQRNLALWEATRGEGNALPGFYWFYKAPKAKPAARVLAFHPDEQNQYGNHPILVTMPYKSGTIFFVASDETWRWRAGVGDRYFHKFWGQVVRYLAHGRFQRSKRFALATDRTRYFLGDDVRFTATVLDEHLQPYVPKTNSEGELVDPQQAVRVEVESPDGGRINVNLEALRSKPGRFEGVYRPTRTGHFKGRLLPPGAISVEEDAPMRPFDVRLPSVELQEPRADRATLEMLAKETGGELFTLAQIDDVIDRVDPIIETIPIDSSEEYLWDRQWVLFLFIGLLTFEWVLRRVMRLP